ncbi:transcription factor [Dimargaris verticillata]|uniref:Transcription factor n=1 Tax=Dimargaris verticillata TaxID=2761393 RepID=A0A9W8B8P2_9FUNG|nr:transcription factor [Dimargaris verticillata]
MDADPRVIFNPASIKLVKAMPALSPDIYPLSTPRNSQCSRLDNYNSLKRAQSFQSEGLGNSPAVARPCKRVRTCANRQADRASLPSYDRRLVGHESALSSYHHVPAVGLPRAYSCTSAFSPNNSLPKYYAVTPSRELRPQALPMTPDSLATRVSSPVPRTPMRRLSRSHSTTPVTGAWASHPLTRSSTAHSGYPGTGDSPLALKMRSHPSAFQFQPASPMQYLATPEESPEINSHSKAKTSAKLLKPKETYSVLIAKAILAAPGRLARLSHIYRWISDHYPYYRTKESCGWQNSVRHNLSLNKSFIRIPADGSSPGSGKGDYWTIHAQYLDKFRHLLPTAVAQAAHHPFTAYAVPSPYRSRAPAGWMPVYPTNSTTTTPLASPTYSSMGPHLPQGVSPSLFMQCMLRGTMVPNVHRPASTPPAYPASHSHQQPYRNLHRPLATSPDATPTKSSNQSLHTSLGTSGRAGLALPHYHHCHSQHYANRTAQLESPLSFASRLPAPQEEDNVTPAQSPQSIVGLSCPSTPPYPCSLSSKDCVSPSSLATTTAPLKSPKVSQSVLNIQNLLN